MQSSDKKLQQQQRQQQHQHQQSKNATEAKVQQPLRPMHSGVKLCALQCSALQASTERL